MIGARDRLDQKLVQLYANVQTINFDTVKTINPDDMWKNMGMLAHTNRAFVQIKQNKQCVASG